MTAELDVAQQVVWQAHHALVLAIPAFVPAIIVVGVVIYVARKDRLEERRENELLEHGLSEVPDDLKSQADGRADGLGDDA